MIVRLGAFFVGMCPFLISGGLVRKIALVMGSDSDLPIIEKAILYLKQTPVDFTVNVLSAHRTPQEAIEFAQTAKDNGYGVIIAAAGMAAHLAGVLAANTVLPVIGIPCVSTNLDGMDALLSTVQMPPGIPVATVAINGAKNAAILACQILAVENDTLTQHLRTQRAEDSQKVLEKNSAISHTYSVTQHN
ncbi:5-(carboxyamino)imidazole ribonucleotide mutase [Arcanobacterium phocae]|uniref:N5-carboxyaminoimidazole ribonucleotide mutase n=1 Tax=Arcanobacterium phocae TaxID=131112 RepID=A0A1H2LK39_9ACTO|nr:5-(carboxyamino)imidazole ribonucleotide mutase [Arcanobacterium phocae]